MKKIKRIKNSQYTTISNSFLRDIRLSLKAKAVLATVMSLPDNWDFSINGLVSIVKEGNSAVRCAINELIDSGYCRLIKERNEGNKFVKFSYLFREDLTIPFIENPQVENLQMENPQVENRTQRNTKDNKKLNKEKTNENIISLDEDFDAFWNLYNKKVGKVAALRSWRKLSKEDRAAAMSGVKPYQESMRGDMHYIKHPATYLNQRTWEDDFADYNRKSFYDVREGDGERLRRFKIYMREKHPAIEQARNPLSLAGYFELTNIYGVDSVENELNDIERNISRYKQSDIAYEISRTLDKKRLQV